MIIFKTIRFKNFQSYGNAWNEINLDEHQLTAINGVNGAGKTSVSNALTFALFGKTINNVTKSKLVNAINGKGLLVEVEFENNNTPYMVRRGLKPNIFEIYRNGELINQESHVNDYQKILEDQILRMNYQSFIQCAFIGSVSFVPFFELPAVKRREVVEALLDVQVLSVMNDILKTKVQSNNQQISDIEYKINTIKSRCDSEMAIIRSLRDARQNNIEKITNHILEKEKELETHIASIEKLEKIVSNREKIETMSKSFTDSHNDLSVRQKTLAKALKDAQKELKFIESHDYCPICHQGIGEEHRTKISEGFKKSISETQANIAQYESEASELAEKEKKFSIVYKKFTEANRQLANENYAVASLNREINRLKKELETPLNNEDIQSHEEKVKDYVLEAKEVVEQKKELYAEKGVLEQASLLLKDNGIKAEIVKQYLPIINRMINHYLETMEFYITVELAEDFSETIKARDRDVFSYQNLSQGERRRLDLAILFTWRHIANLKNSCSANTLILDEIDQGLDLEGFNIVMRLFRSLENTNIFITSHRENVHEFPFDKVITMVKKNQFSVIEEV